MKTDNVVAKGISSDIIDVLLRSLVPQHDSRKSKIPVLVMLRNEASLRFRILS